LQQAAVAALNSITAVNCSQQQVLDSVLLYLGKHGRHVDSVWLKVRGAQWGAVDLRQLPPNLRLSSLHLKSFSLQLQPGYSFRGVLGVAADLAGLKQLHLCGGTLVDDKLSEALAASLSLLLALEHLSIRLTRVRLGPLLFNTGALQHLQQLTFLGLGQINLQAPDVDTPVLQPLQCVTKLAHLQLSVEGELVTADTLSGNHHLTHLELSGFRALDPLALAGKTHLQYLELQNYGMHVGRAGDEAQLLSQLQHLQQLTHLTLRSMVKQNQPAAAFSALTVSSKLQHLR
jgi:hypothetical protein